MEIVHNFCFLITPYQKACVSIGIKYIFEMLCDLIPCFAFSSFIICSTQSVISWKQMQKFCLQLRRGQSLVPGLFICTLKDRHCTEILLTSLIVTPRICWYKLYYWVLGWFVSSSGEHTTSNTFTNALVFQCIYKGRYNSAGNNFSLFTGHMSFQIS